jgi:hypothetical protein
MFVESRFRVARAMLRPDHAALTDIGGCFCCVVVRFPHMIQESDIA